MNFIPDWLSFLSVILLTLSDFNDFIALLFYFYHVFWLYRSPFNGLLAEKSRKNADGGKY